MAHYNLLPEIHEALINDPTKAFVTTKFGDMWPVNEILGYRRQNLHIYPGSFNPLHDGHRAIFEIAKRYSSNSFFELSINRFDKLALTVEEIEKRLRQFEGYGQVIVTNVPKFVEKAGVLRMNGAGNDIFQHIGADSLQRLMSYTSIAEVEGFACKFIYYKRMVNGKLMEMPKKLPRNCFFGGELPETAMGISSTSLRAAGITL